MKKVLLITLIPTLLYACGNPTGNPQQKTITADPDSCSNSIYYWKTIFSLNDAEQQFLTDYEVKRLYIRYFDVAHDPEDRELPSPVATIRFNDSIPRGMEVIPTVFIDNNLFRSDRMSGYPSKITNRILTMSATHDVGNIHEIQIDCDWTKTTEVSYFDFLKILRHQLRQHNIRLSATIRLHQLSMKAPPVDSGVLMCYNTGAVLNRETNNSILTASAVKPYAAALSTYPLPLDMAYPTFTWAVWFREGAFKALLRSMDRDHQGLKYMGDNIYQVKKGFYQEGHYLAAGDEIRFEDSLQEEIVKTKELLEPQLSHFSVIIYHLDSANLSKYTPDEINKIYNN